MLIYCALNTVNGKRYIGITSMTLSGRWAGHVWSAKNGSPHLLHKAIRKYGRKAFVVEEIARLMPGMDHKSLCELERTLIAQEGTKLPNGYNMTDGGEGTSGYKWKPEAVARMAASKKKYWTDEKRQEQAVRVKGTKQSEETKQKHRDSWTPERRAEQSKDRRGKSPSEETRAKISAAKKGKQVTSSEKLSEARRAMLADPARREKFSQKQKASWTLERRAENAEKMVSVGKMARTPERMAAHAEAIRHRHKEGVYANRKGWKMSPEVVAAQKAAWTPERRAAQAERARTQKNRRGKAHKTLLAAHKIENEVIH